MYLNKVFLFGNLTRDPELKALPSGIKVANFAIATNRTYKDKDGGRKDSTEYHNLVAFGKQAEVIAQYLKKGRGIFVDGRLQTRAWDDKATGAKKYRTEVIVENFQFGPSTGGGERGNFASAEPTEAKADKIDTIEYPTEEINPEDIPF